ncbi:hypothetical protein SKAU_G00076280 [Synaphobranchus kaupii]|uniref:SPRY-associated domain-containing protein n=1 Tax=Synaphobranchus kaupii TaxID=118154 RepID=A0A9Q1G7Q9_SYNKA|nr:hypothetical protein SKAU_G00076280 [Synaphobranchus kaupii]
MSALGESAKPSSPVWCVWPLTVKLTSSLTMNLLLLRSTDWSKPLEPCRRRSALIITKFWMFTVVPISKVSVICAHWMNTEAMIQSHLQQNGLRNGSSWVRHRRSAQAAVEDSEKIFTELIRSIERRCSEVKKLIKDQEKAEVSRAERLLERLEQEIAELRRRDAELEQLSHTEDHIHFLQSCQSLCGPPGPGDLPSITVSPHISFEAVRKSVSELKEKLEDVFKTDLIKVSGRVEEIPVICQPKTREDFLLYSCRLTLDPNTANKHLLLSEGNREVTHHRHHTDHRQRYCALQMETLPWGFQLGLALASPG